MDHRLDALTRSFSVSARWLALLLAGGALLMLGIPSAHAGNGIAVCHRTGSLTRPFVLISVSARAVPAHQGHRDTIAPDFANDPNNCGGCGIRCDDGNSCTIDECVTGECVNTPRTCDDNNVCTDDACTPSTGACGNTPIPDRVCDDGEACTTGDSCDATGACAGTPVPCDDDPAFKGHAWPLSAAPGEQIDFMVSGLGSNVATFLRHEVTAAVGATQLVEEVRGSASFTPALQPVRPEMWRIGTGWAPSFSLIIPGDWPSGIYSARLTDGAGTLSYIPFIVKAAPDRHSGVALLANVNTWLAYNNWGGNGKYPGAAYVSFLRPAPTTSPALVGFDGEHLTRGELLMLSWLRQQGFAPDVYTDIDFHNGALTGGGYHTLVVTTHPEYWTEQMYDNLKAFLDAGGSLLYLGGNGIYEKGSYYPDQTGMVFRNGDDTIGTDRLTSTLFRADPARIERALLGVSTRRCGVIAGTLEIVTGAAGDPLLAGTGLSDHDQIGAQSASSTTYYTSVSGLEVDHSGDTRILPDDCGTYRGPPEPEDFPVSSSPAGLRVLARAAAGVDAELVAYDHPGGGLVVSGGSISFASSLAVDPDLRAIIRNVLVEAADRAP